MSYYRDGDFLRELGEQIRKIRTQKGLSQEQLANQCNLPTSQIGRMERGEVNASLSYLPLLSTALEVPIKKLIEFDVSD